MPVSFPRALMAVAAAVAVASSLQAQCSQLGNATPGTNLQLTDESNRSVALPFTLVFNNHSYDTITVNSNGFIWLGVNDGTDFFPDPFTALSDAPRLMPAWWDLDPGVGGIVSYATTPTSVSICWQNVPEYFAPASVANFECTIDSSGVIAFHYGANTVTTNSDVLIGITGGNGATANPRVFTADVAGSAQLGSATGTQQLLAPATNPLNNSWLTFVPLNAQGTNYVVLSLTQPTCPNTSWPPMTLSTNSTYGTGCPAAVPGSAIYEGFTLSTGASPVDLANTSIRFVRGGGSYTTVPGTPFDSSYTTGQILPMGDDTLQTHISVGPMGNFPFGTHTLSQVTACSNGFLWLNDSQDFDFSPTTAELLSQGRRIAPLWTDLNFDPTVNTGAGNFYVENTGPFLRCTWAGVPEYNVTSSNTFQVTLFSNGDIQFAYAAIQPGLGAQSPVVGISDGAVAPVPAASNLVSAGVVNVITRTISGVDTAALSVGPCLIGGSFMMKATVPSPSLAFAGFVVSYTQVAPPGLDLGPANAPGCFLHVGAFDFLFVNTSPFSEVTETQQVPLNPLILGLPLFAQVGVATAGNGLGFYTSNGVAFTIGNAF